jgi:hypothetical protein
MYYKRMPGRISSLISSQDPSMSHVLESFTNPSNKDQLEERMARIKEDPSLKPILEEIENGGPAAMMRLEVLRCLFCLTVWCSSYNQLTLNFHSLKRFKFWYCRYWNDKEVLQKLGEAMGVAVSGDATTSAENSVPDEAEDLGNEDESIVHQTASVGDVEV